MFSKFRYHFWRRRLLHLPPADSPHSCGGHKTIVPPLCIHQDSSWMSKDNDISNNTTYRLNRQMWDRLMFVPLSPVLHFRFTSFSIRWSAIRGSLRLQHTRSQSCFWDGICLIRDNKRLKLGLNILMNGSEIRCGRNGCFTGTVKQNLGVSLCLDKIIIYAAPFLNPRLCKTTSVTGRCLSQGSPTEWVSPSVIRLTIILFT